MTVMCWSQSTRARLASTGAERENRDGVQASRATPAAMVGSKSQGTGCRSVRRVAMDCLARREHSFFELKQKLQEKLPHHGIGEIDAELARLRQENLQSDRRFAEAFVRNRQSRGYGYLRIRDELRNRFVAEELIDELLERDPDHWLSQIEGLLLRRLGPHGRLPFGSKEHQRVARFLMARGFPSDLVHRALRKYVTR